ncbi:MAG TPA: hypothetical protein VFW00_08350 [Rhodocyclaceae bacterium]|nr:hypothetical protein [Rhodocyclaceae bacterium]
MEFYGISMIRLDATGTEVNEVKLHKVLHRPVGTDEIEANPGERVQVGEVVRLLANGDFVWILVDDGPGSFMHTDAVRIKEQAGPASGIESHDTNGQRTNALFRLPRF